MILVFLIEKKKEAERAPGVLEQQELDKKAPKVKRVVGKTFAFYFLESFGT